MQSELYSRFETVLFPPTLGKAITHRLSLSLPEHNVPWTPQLEEHLGGLLRRAGPAAAFAVLKTWLSGWCTSNRVKEKLELPCLFGCQGEGDNLQHYLTCRHAWRMIGNLCGNFPVCRLRDHWQAPAYHSVYHFGPQKPGDLCQAVSQHQA